jgi:hypothetical protein
MPLGMMELLKEDFGGNQDFKISGKIRTEYRKY